MVRASHPLAGSSSRRFAQERLAKEVTIGPPQRRYFI